MVACAIILFRNFRLELAALNSNVGRNEKREKVKKKEREEKKKYTKVRGILELIRHGGESIPIRNMTRIFVQFIALRVIFKYYFERFLLKYISGLSLTLV